MNKGSIIYVGGFELPDKNAAAHRVLNNAKLLKKLGYNVVLLGISKDLEWKSDIYNHRFKLDDFECWQIPYPRSKKQWLSYVSSIIGVVEVSRNYSNIKAIICYNYQSIAFMKLKKYCNKNNYKIIADCTEWYDGNGNNNKTLRIFKKIDNFMRINIIQKRLDGLIVISEFLKEYYRGVRNTIILPPLVDLNESKWILEKREKNNVIRLTYAGNGAKNKDKLNILVELLSKVKEKKYLLNIVGVSKDEYLKENEEQRLILNELEGVIIFNGRLTHNESLEILKNSDFSIFFREKTRMCDAGFPTKFVESIACGVPVITTKTSDLEKYLVDDINGFFIDINDVEESLLKIDKILNLTSDKIEVMKKETKKIKSFDYNEYIEEMSNLLKDSR